MTSADRSAQLSTPVPHDRKNQNKTSNSPDFHNFSVSLAYKIHFIFTDPDNKGKLIDDYWAPGQKMMGDIKFLDTLRAYDKDNIPKAIMKTIREKYVNNPYFDPNLVKKVSTACEGLCRWVRAIEVYDRVIKIVSPKKAKLAEAETELARQMDKLNEKRTQLQQVTDKLQALNDEFAAMTKKKKDLEDNIELCSQKLDRAEKLIHGLGGERDRWSDMAVSLGSRLINITGDVLLASGVVAYLVRL